jgi:hypothetical protein
MIEQRNMPLDRRPQPFGVFRIFVERFHISLA